MEAVVFFVSAAVILGGAIGVITLRHPVHAVLSLVATLFGVALQFINLEAYFLAAVQVIVYAGAIVILFLFVIMLLGVDRVDEVRSEPIIGQRQFAMLAAAGLLVLAALVGVAVSGDVTGVPSPEASRPVSAGGLAIEQAVETDDGFTVAPEENVREIGRALFTSRYLFAFEITAILLTIAVVGAVVLARRPRGELEEIPALEVPWPLRRAMAGPNDEGDAESAGGTESAEPDSTDGDETAADPSTAEADEQAAS